MKEKYTNIEDGQTFELAGIEFIKFPATADGVPVVVRNVQNRMRFGKSNDLRSSEVLDWLQKEFLPKIVADIGEENLVEFKTDLTTWDGLKDYGILESRVSLPTMDFYRENVEIFDKHPVDEWWWLATPDSCKPHDDPEYVLCVAPSCYFSGNFYFYFNIGVRPFLILKSSIFESLES